MTDEAPWIFIGGRRHGQLLLTTLFERGHRPVFTYILEEDPHEHEKHSTEIAALCVAHGVSYKVTKKVGMTEVSRISALRPNLIAVMGWRTIIPADVLAIPKLGAVALHDSLLPRYRGFAPINWAIINGEHETGVSLFYLDEGVDSGPVIAQQRIGIGPDDTGADVYEMVTTASVALMSEYIPLLARARQPAEAQDPTEATFTCSRTPEDGRIDWSAPTRAVYDLVRALAFPYPGAFTTLEGRRLVVWNARPVQPAPTYAGRVPGRVVALGADGVDVLTADGVLRLLEVQLEGHERRPAGELIRSVRATLGRGDESSLVDLELLETVYQMQLPPGRARTA